MKRIKVIVLALILSLCTSLLCAPVTQAKSIYFSGRYEGSGGSTIGSTISLSKFSSPSPGEKKRKEVGSFEIDIPHFFGAYNGVLVKIGTNKYRSKKKGLVFKVYKKKIVVTVTNKQRYDKELNGTYKLVERYYS